MNFRNLISPPTVLPFFAAKKPLSKGQFNLLASLQGGRGGARRLNIFKHRIQRGEVIRGMQETQITSRMEMAEAAFMLQAQEEAQL